MRYRASTILAAILVAGFLFAGQATAIMEPTFGVVDYGDPQPTAGQMFTITLDLDIDEDFCAVDFFMLLEGDGAALVDASRRQRNPEAPAACVSYSTTAGFNPICPECDTQVYCLWEDRFDARPIVLGEDGEIDLEFMRISPGEVTIHAAGYAIYSLDPGDRSCDQIVAVGDAEPSVVTLPEPGEMALLAAGLPLLAAFAIRRNRRG